MRNLYQSFLDATGDDNEVIKAVRSLVKRELRRLDRVKYNSGRPKLDDTPERERWRAYKRKS